jgi:ATP/maltotriose-dependent transcriptional regulator MalT
MCIPIEIQSGNGDSLPALAEAAELAQGRPLSDAIVWVRQAQSILLVRQGHTQQAVERVQRLREDVERAGRTRDLSRVHYIAAAVLERAGRCRESAESGLISADLWADVDLPPAGGFTLRGAAALNTLDVPTAVESLTNAIAAAESTKDPEWAAYAHILLGRADLLRRRPADAARHLGRGLDLLHDLGYRDPALILVHADLAEALVLSGDMTAAASVIEDGRTCADRYGRTVVRLGLDRAQALLDGYTGDPRAAADALRSQLSEGHPYPLEIARCFLTLAALERRARRRAAARTALLEAARMFDDAGCTPCAQHARESLDQLDPADAPASDLERRLLDLVRSGASNRTIAATLHLSVKAVEANLTRLYRRFGVSGRAELNR